MFKNNNKLIICSILSDKISQNHINEAIIFFM